MSWSAPKTIRHGSGVGLRLDDTRLLVRFRRPLKPPAAERFLRRTAFMREASATPGEQKREGRFRELVNDSYQQYWLRIRESRAIEDEDVDALLEMGGTAIEWIAPVYRFAGVKDRSGLVSFRPDVLLVRSKGEARSKKEVRWKALLEHDGFREIPERSAALVGFRYFRLISARRRAVWHLLPRIKERCGLGARDIRFETVPLLMPIHFVPNDPHFGRQWNMTQIAAETAWNLSKGHPSIVVAVMDSGCDLSHPDLTFASAGVNLNSMAPTGAPVSDRGHGTSCAGVIAARIDNGQGVAGLAGRCRILPLALDSGSDAEAAAGFKFAADNGASVLSMSLGFRNPDKMILDPAIKYAYDKRVILVASAGNSNEVFTQYPAAHPLVMPVGGSSIDDNRKTPDSPDGEDWGASYGPDTSVVAPCVLTPTTDLQGAHGYNSGGEETENGDSTGDYYFRFNGTSSAAPHVAGLAALVLSVNCFLDNREVRDVIEQTADRVGAIPYSLVPGDPNGPRNDEMGHGRINARRAVETAAAHYLDTFRQLFQ